METDRLETGYGRFALMAETLGRRHQGLAELTAATGMAKHQAIAALKALAAVGWAERDAAGWRLTTRLPRVVAEHCRHEIRGLLADYVEELGITR